MIGGVFLIVSCVALLGFPKELPGAREKREELIKEGNLPTKDEKIKETFKDILPATWQLLKNPVFIFNALALTASTFFAGALVPFISKILYLKFDLIPAKAGLMIGIAIIPGSIGKYTFFRSPARATRPRERAVEGSEARCPYRARGSSLRLPKAS